MKKKIVLNRETIRMLFFLGVALMVWLTGFYLWGLAENSSARVKLHRGRFVQLLEVAEKYVALPHREGRGSDKTDPMVALSSIIDSVGLKENLVQLSSTGRGVSIQMDRLYGDLFATFVQEIYARDLSIESAEIRSYNIEDERLFTVTLLVGDEQ